MSNYGVKISKPGKDINSENIEDYVFWSKYPALQLLEKKEDTITIGSSSCSGTKNVSFNYNYLPLVIGIVKDNTTGNRFLMPAKDFASINCGFGVIPILEFSYKVKSGQVEITYNAECVLMGSSSCPLSDKTFTIELYFYSWELGQNFPFV